MVIAVECEFVGSFASGHKAEEDRFVHIAAKLPKNRLVLETLTILAILLH